MTEVTPQVGNSVVVHLDFSDEEGNTVEERQFYGKIDRITDSEVVIKHPSSGEEISLPPFFGSYEHAPEGEYELPSTGEKVPQPDFITKWTLRVASES